MKVNSISGVFLDADLERLIEIDLPVVEHEMKTYLKGKLLSTIRVKYGELIAMGDFHYGHESFSQTVLRGYLSYLKSHPHIQIGLMGDILEYGQGSRFIKDDERIPIDEQISLFLADFKPFRDRIKFMLWGNHEERFAMLSQSKKLMDDIAREMGLEPGKNVFVGKPQRGLFAVLKAGKQKYGAQIHHSKTAAAVNQDIQLSRTGSQNVVALIMHGHTHRLGSKPRTFRSLEMIDEKVFNVVRRQYLVATGCFIKYPSYAEARSMPYTDVGAPIVKCYSEENNIEVYDLSGFYKNYLARGGLPAPESVQLSEDFRRQLNPFCSGVLGSSPVMPDLPTSKIVAVQFSNRESEKPKYGIRLFSNGAINLVGSSKSDFVKKNLLIDIDLQNRKICLRESISGVTVPNVESDGTIRCYSKAACNILAGSAIVLERNDAEHSWAGRF
jgi:hypothetical protein